jgi:hypothetical protein
MSATESLGVSLPKLPELSKFAREVRYLRLSDGEFQGVGL